MGILYVILLATVGIARAWGQCGSVQACSNQEFPYRFCPFINGQPEVICTTTPTNILGKTALRNLFPLCARVVAGPDDPQTVYIRDVNGVDVVVYNPAQLQAEVDLAIEAWNCLCGNTTPNMQINSTCCSQIRWTRNPRDFSGVTAGTFRLGEQQVSVFSTPPQSCGELGCYNENSVPTPVGRRQMLLNNTEDFRSPVGAGPSAQRMLYTGPVLPTGPGNAALNNLAQVWSIRDVITHEIGHWAGLIHPDAENPPNNTLRCDKTGAPSRGIMTSTTTSGTNPKGISDQDKCQFMRLYCPTITSIDQEVKLIAAKDELMVCITSGVYHWNVGGCTSNDLRVWNIHGDEITTPPFTQGSDGFITVYCNNLPKTIVVLSLICSASGNHKFCLLQVE